MKRAYIVLTGLFLSFQIISAQELESSRSKIGFGVSFFNMPEYLYESSPGNNVYLTIYNNNFRFEPTFGFSLSKNEQKYFFGLGFFHEKQLSDFKLLSGIRLGVSYGSIYVIAPTIGGEYFFNDHFSIGSEVQLRGSIDSNHLTLLTNSAVIARFYF